MNIEVLSACAVILTIALATLIGAGALYVFARTMFFLVQSIGFVRAMENTARTNFAYDVAERKMNEPDRKPQVETYGEDDLAAAVRASRATTGPAFIEGYDEPPPSASEAYNGATIDGEQDQPPFPGGGLYAEQARR